MRPGSSAVGVKGSSMIEFDVKCRICGKPLTLQVRDSQSRVFFEKYGALCEACSKPGYPVARLQCAA
jgi:hypothetical protein